MPEILSGALPGGEGLYPRSKRARARLTGTKRTVVDGPLAETRELIAGFWLWQLMSWQVRSKDKALAGVGRCPNRTPDVGSDIEIRQVFDADDFGAEFTPELREKEEPLRAKVAAKN